MFHFRTCRSAAVLLLLSTTALAQTGYAASYLDTFYQRVKTVYTVSLADLTQTDSNLTTRTLDWQRSSIDLFFDLPPAERTSDITLALSADPLTRVAKNAPLRVQFNDSKPVPVLSNGRGFEARLPFDAANSRSGKNVIRISYPIPPGADCVAPAHGAWSIDLSASTLRMAGRAQRRHMSLSEVNDYLSQPALSPKKVGLIARGPDGTDMQALAAQGVALRTPGLPKFSVAKSGNDFNIIMVKRNRLIDVTDDPMILDSQGARIFVPRGRPTKLIFTADTDAEIVQMLQLFATRKLPNTRRPISSLGELNLQNRLNSDIMKIERKTPLMDIAVESDIAPGSQSYKFGAIDPIASSGEILLRLSSMNDVADDSRLRVALNGNVLGAAKLDKKRKSVAFQIVPGMLNATSNTLNIVPDLNAPKGYSCPTPVSERPSFLIRDGSRITLNKTVPSPVTELSRLTSTGGLFAQSESYIALPQNTREFQSSLRVLGRLAKSAGHGLTLADYTRSTAIPEDKHRLIIGPSYMAKAHLSGAPKALKDAMSGQSSTGENLLEASYESFASAGLSGATMQYAAKQNSTRRVSRGGIAALYGSGNGNLTGIISSAPGQSFVQASHNLIQLDHWNALQGGVSRWTSSSVVMAQTAQTDAAIRKPLKKRFEFPEIGLASINLPDLDWSDVTWPEFEIPEFELPDFEMPQVSWSKFKWPESIALKDEKENELRPMKREVYAPKTQSKGIRDLGLTKQIPIASKKIAKIKPRLKPINDEQTHASTGLRGPFQFSETTESRFGSWQNFRRHAESKWTATKVWLKSQTESIRDAQTLEEVSLATDRLQDRVTPAGKTTKASLLNKLPGKSFLQLGDRTVSVYGLMLIMAFAFVLLLMSLAKPSSRLGGRH